jgi:hypothetical protein
MENSFSDIFFEIILSLAVFFLREYFTFFKEDKIKKNSLKIHGVSIIGGMHFQLNIKYV